MTPPVALDADAFLAEPLSALAVAREAHGDAFAIRTEGAIFSRASDCSGVVCAFGPALVRSVLSDIRAFGMPPSAGRRLQFDERLINLNRSLHSMIGQEHDTQKRLLTAALNVRDADAEASAAWRALEDAAGGWVAGEAFGLLSRMRELTLRVSAALLFGDGSERVTELVSLLQTYFFARREASAPGDRDERTLAGVSAAGYALDDALRSYVDACREGDVAGGGLLSKLARLDSAGGRLSVDEIVGHMNILFISSTEPLAVALTWTLLIASQSPELRRALRDEARTVAGAGIPTGSEVERLVLHDRVISESMRLLPPNAFMVRLTTEPVRLGAFALPANCEVILCPYVSHRDAHAFAEPDRFRPERWEQPPPPFNYFPFGAGGHVCIGKPLAMRTMKLALAFLLSAHDVVLAGDQEIDWRLHIQFMPKADPAAMLWPAGATAAPAGELRGPVRAMTGLDAQ